MSKDFKIALIVIAVVFVIICGSLFPELFSFGSSKVNNAKNEINNEIVKNNNQQSTKSFATADAPQSKEKELSQADLAENYIKNAADSNGKISIWRSQKIYVYVNDSPYKETILRVFAKYNGVFKDYFQFKLAQSKNNANITVDVVSSLENTNKDEMFVAGLTKNYVDKQNNSLSRSSIQLLAIDPQTRKTVTKNEMYAVLMHEIGHALGIVGHSGNDQDVMYPFSQNNRTDFSKRDITTIKVMYSGDERTINRMLDGVAEAKIKEAEKYANDASGKTVAWINLGQMYYSKGELNKALGAYKKALTLDNTDPNIYQSMAECYSASGKHETAIKYFQYALSLATNRTDKLMINESIGVTYAMMEKYDEAENYLAVAYKGNTSNYSFLYNLLLNCNKLNKKSEAKSYIEMYSGNKNNLDEKYEQIVKWANS